MNKILALAATIALTATSAFSQVGFSNGGVEITYRSFEWSNGPSTNPDTAIGAFGIFNLTNSFDLQVGASFSTIDYEFGPSYSDTGYDLHAIYNLSNGSRIGAFYTSSGLWDADVTFASYGIEYQYSSGPISIQIQGGATQHFETDATFILVDATYSVGDFSFGAEYGYFSDDFDSGTQASIRVGYGLPSLYNAEIFAEYAFMSSDDYSFDGSHIEVGLKIPFGAGSATPFGSPSSFMRNMHIYTD